MAFYRFFLRKKSFNFLGIDLIGRDFTRAICLRILIYERCVFDRLDQNGVKKR